MSKRKEAAAKKIQSFFPSPSGGFEITGVERRERREESWQTGKDASTCSQAAEVAASEHLNGGHRPRPMVAGDPLDQFKGSGKVCPTQNESRIHVPEPPLAFLPKRVPKRIHNPSLGAGFV
ncbi:disintegrin and metalloproteinase domain-containing protein 10-like isoform 2 [Anopheles sinensis]|uniref:Disintegrin and metalloproteinase domain-containing protein 10-like isoform 2 n=1 Tax=Anopheles sinensis TaxID=74873 RepID=A0A084VR43_ANOSI|nr:disintegrin and metalloproteinase domain-containing protein 10-like isoform 2 [Anopheles sinensis]